MRRGLGIGHRGKLGSEKIPKLQFLKIQIHHAQNGGKVRISGQFPRLQIPKLTFLATDDLRSQAKDAKLKIPMLKISKLKIPSYRS